MCASGQLLRISRAHEQATVENLELRRKPLCDHANEDQALESALVEFKRWDDAEATLRYHKDLHSALASFKGPDWATRLLEEEKGTKPWGFAQYVDPLATVHVDLEHYFARSDALLTFAEINIRYGKHHSGKLLPMILTLGPVPVQNQKHRSIKAFCM